MRLHTNKYTPNIVDTQFNYVCIGVLVSQLERCSCERWSRNPHERQDAAKLCHTAQNQSSLMEYSTNKCLSQGPSRRLFIIIIIIETNETNAGNIIVQPSATAAHKRMRWIAIKMLWLGHEITHARHSTHSSSSTSYEYQPLFACLAVLGGFSLNAHTDAK